MVSILRGVARTELLPLTSSTNLQSFGQTIAAARGWAPLLLLPALVILTTPDAWPRWALMWLLAFAIYVGCKWLTWRRTPSDAPWWVQAGYLLAWPGLDARSFLAYPAKRIDKPRAAQWAHSVTNIALGLTLFCGYARWSPDSTTWVIGFFGMVGVLLTLHFGLFLLLSCLWRRAGVDAKPLMDYPSRSVSLSEFWGKRWNRAFRDLTHRFLFAPLTAWFGPRMAIFGGFIFSGLVHDLVISLPAGGGYGLPTLYFAIQGAGLLLERRLNRKFRWARQKYFGRIFTLAIVAGPVRLLVHEPFVQQVVVPFMQALSAA